MKIKLEQMVEAYFLAGYRYKNLLIYPLFYLQGYDSLSINFFKILWSFKLIINQLFIVKILSSRTQKINNFQSIRCRYLKLAG